MFTATALGFFQHELDKAIVLSLFLPLIISSGGNSGSQASTLVIRAMALGEVRVADWLRVFRREVQMGIVLGAILGGVASVRVMVWGAAGAYEGSAGEHFVRVGLTVALSLVGCVLWGTLMGAMLPFLLRKVKADPASASAPLVATLVDVSGIIIYFTIAQPDPDRDGDPLGAEYLQAATRDEITATFSDPTLVQRIDAPHERGNTSRCQWTGVTGTLTMHAEISDKGSYEDARDDAAAAVDLPNVAEAAYYDPALRELTAYQHDTLITVGFAGTPTPEQIEAGTKALVAKIAPRL